jgi:uncharacterized protein with HEPN domain
MRKDDYLYLGHMLDTAQKILRKVEGVERGQFDQDENLRIALAHLIQVIGEAARRVSSEFCQAHPQIPWKGIVGMRHKVVHDYMNLNDDVVWQTATEEIGPLAAELEALVPPDACDSGR